MENHNFTLKKISSFLSSSLSSCQFRTLPDVAESSIPIPKKTNKTFHEKNLKKETEKIPNKNPTISNHSNRNSDKKPKQIQECKKIGTRFSLNQSSSATSGWFSSSDEKTPPDAETATLFSFSSNSGNTFRLNTSQRFKKCEEMKSIDERGCSFSSVTSFDPVLSRHKPKNPSKNVSNKVKSHKFGKIYPEYELGFDQISARIYYSKRSRSGASFRCQKLVKKCQSTLIEESYAVEKSSSDPYGDFRVSMVEMIVEKQIFGAEDLERLLNCFLNLNAILYHEMIVDVFCEVCETLFNN